MIESLQWWSNLTEIRFLRKHKNCLNSFRGGFGHTPCMKESFASNCFSFSKVLPSQRPHFNHVCQRLQMPQNQSMKLGPRSFHPKPPAAILCCFQYRHNLVTLDCQIKILKRSPYDFGSHNCNCSIPEFKVLTSSLTCLPCARRSLLPISSQSRFSGVYVINVRCFRKGKFEEMLAISYLVLQACVSFLRCFRHEWPISVFALFLWKCHCSYAHQDEVHLPFTSSGALQPARLWMSKAWIQWMYRLHSVGLMLYSKMADLEYKFWVAVCR